MNKFINIRDGKISVTSYRPADCQATTLDDLITCAVAGTDDYLTACFATDELCKHPLAYDFLNAYGIECGNHYEFAGEYFEILADNTVAVAVGWDE